MQTIVIMKALNITLDVQSWVEGGKKKERNLNFNKTKDWHNSLRDFMQIRELFALTRI